MRMGVSHQTLLDGKFPFLDITQCLRMGVSRRTLLDGKLPFLDIAQCLRMGVSCRTLLDGKLPFLDFLQCLRMGVSRRTLLDGKLPFGKFPFKKFHSIMLHKENNVWMRLLNVELQKTMSILGVFHWKFSGCETPIMGKSHWKNDIVHYTHV